MMKNDYRRALIMLRAAEPGLSGYVRLERRTLMGTMQFNVSGLRSTASLQAAMAARTACGWKIVHIGTLGQNLRGQAGLNWTFDPRSIEGLPLEKYAVLLVLAIEDGECRTLMTGYVNGSVQVDWQRVEDAACASYASVPQPITWCDAQGDPEGALAEEADDSGIAGTQENCPICLPEEEDGILAAQEERIPGTTPIFVQAEEEAETDEADICAQEERLPGTTPIFRSAEQADEMDAAASAFVQEEEGMDVPARAEEAMDIAVQGSAAAPTEDPMDSPAGAGAMALQALGIDPEQRWPDGIEPLRAAFASAQPVYLSAQPDHVFIRAWHSASCPECAVGIRAKDGQPESVAWAIPGEKAKEPPQGLEGYTWKDGWWIAVADAKNGAYRVIAPD